MPADFKTNVLSCRRHEVQTCGMKNLSALVALLLLPLAAFARAVTALPPISAITFAPGSTTATMNRQMVPGGRDLYYPQAKAGQTMNVALSSAAPLTFQVYDSEPAVTRAADGSPLIADRTCPTNDDAPGSAPFRAMAST